MKPRLRFSNPKLASLLVLPIVACLPLASSSNPDTGEQDPPNTGPEGTLPRVQVLATERPSNVPTFVRGHLGLQAANDLRAVARLLHASPGDLILKSTTRDTLGDLHSRYIQKKHGREVLGADLVVHARNGIIYAANGTARTDLPAPTEVAISPAQAAVQAIGSYPRDSGAAADEAHDLAYWRKRGGIELLLVYQLTVRGVAEDGPLVDTVLVNAIDGSIVDRIPTIMTAKARAIYDANQTTSRGTLKRSEASAAVNDSAVNAAYDNLGATYDAYKSLFDRDSLDGNGMTMIASVHSIFQTSTGTTKNNASWNGSQMKFGDGDGTTFSNLAHSIDVAGHELTHGVTSHTSNLTYSGQSGGLNEAMSDIFGAVVEWYHAERVVSANTWTVGEDVYTPATAGDALRYMSNPTKDGRSIDYAPDFTSGMNVHYSSGVPNLAFYLLSEGGTHPRGKTTVTVTGIGIEKAARIFYRTNTSILTSSAVYEDAKTGSEQAAADLGYTADEIAQVTNAWLAVGVGSTNLD